MGREERTALLKDCSEIAYCEIGSLGPGTVDVEETEGGVEYMEEEELELEELAFERAGGEGVGRGWVG